MINAKKFLLIPTLALLLGTAVGCSTDNRTMISYGTKIHQKAVEIETYEEFVLKVERGENMLIGTYMSGFSETCGCWVTFKNVLNEYVQEYDTMVYIMDRALLAGKETYGVSIYYASDPAVVVFNNGKLMNQYVDGATNGKMFDSLKEFRSAISKVIKDPQMMYVDEAYLDSNLAMQDKALVHYIWNFCSDCSYCFPNVIQPYMNKHELSTEMWIIDLAVPGLLLDENGSFNGTDVESYKKFLNKYQLTEESNPTFGYGRGYVPTTQYWEKGTLIDANVYLNDKLTQNENGDWVVTQTYYTEERVKNLAYTDTVLEGIVVPANEVVEGSWIKENAAKYHDDIMIAFLDKYAL